MKADNVPIDAAKLNARMSRHNVTAEDVADALRVKPLTVRFWTLGGGDIDPVHLYKLAKLFHCPMTAFLPDDFKKEGV